MKHLTGGHPSNTGSARLRRGRFGFQAPDSLPQPGDDGGCEGDGREEQVAAAGVAHGDGVPVFQARKGCLDAAALLVELAVVAGGAASSTASRDADADALGFQLVAQPVGIMALVADQPLGPGGISAKSTKAPLASLI